MTQPLLQAADLRGAARLTTEAVAGLAGLVEAVHARVITAPAIAGLGGGGAAPERTGGLTGLIYGTVRGVTQLVGASAEALLGGLAPLLTGPDVREPPRPEREAVLAALNGVLGDHLAAGDNPLAIEMAFRHGGRPLVLERGALRARLPGATRRILVLVHGLCMNDLQWQRGGHDHGEALARAAGWTPVYLHYNSGLSVSTNGRILARLMERLYDAWPMPVERLAMVGHSMGGLVARSAIHHGLQIQRGGLRWPPRVTELVCLGTPHLGAPLERAGHGIDQLLGAAPYAAPLARLGTLRSAGIKDLRYGNIVVGAPSDDATRSQPPVALPDGVRCFAVAASRGAASGRAPDALPGDGLVPVASALGRHPDPACGLAFDPEHQAVVHDTGHLDLLSSAPAFDLLQRWLA